jgi:hypothetical protein
MFENKKYSVTIEGEFPKNQDPRGLEWAIQYDMILLIRPGTIAKVIVAEKNADEHERAKAAGLG